MTTSTTSLRAFLAQVAAAAFILGATALRLNGPQPGPLAAEARAIVSELLREQVPHPVGSPANRVVRDRILARFRVLGYAPEVQRAYSCGGRRHRCAWVENIVVLPPAGDKLVVAVAHYDSVAAGPGVSDDGLGVATMLVCAARVRTVGYLITDGEEAGLLGAEAFVRDPRAARVVAVVNVEDRGTSGPSYLFETSRDNRDLVPLFNRIPRPITSSLFYTAYELMPNDTDVSVFKRAGKIAVNFAAIGDVENYHHATDDLAHVDMRTLEHHVENALAMLRALSSANLSRMRRSNAVWFDVLGFFLVWWPAWLSIWVAVASFVVLLFRRPSWRDAVAFIAAILLAAAIGIVAMLVTRHRLAHPGWLIALMWVAGIACSLWLLRGRSFEGRAIVWHVLAIVVALTLPGVAFLFLVPAVAMHGKWLAAPAAAIVFFPICLVLYTALAAPALPAIAVLMAMYGSTIAK